MPEKEPKIVGNTAEQETRLTPEGKEIIGLFQQAVKETNRKKQEELFQEFWQKLDKAVTPKNSNLHVKSMLHEIKNIALGKSRDQTLYIGSGTSGQRIHFRDHIFLRKDQPELIERLTKGANISGLNDSIEAESSDGKPRWMTYYRPEGNDWTYGKDYWKCFTETFGEEIVDLFQELK